MSRREIRPLRSDDFPDLMRLDGGVLARAGEAVLARAARERILDLLGDVPNAAVGA